MVVFRDTLGPNDPPLVAPDERVPGITGVRVVVRFSARAQFTHCKPPQRPSEEMPAFLHFSIQISALDGIGDFIIVLQRFGFSILQLIKDIKPHVVLHVMCDIFPLDAVLIIFRPIPYTRPPMAVVGKSCGELVIRPLRHRWPSIGASCNHNRFPRHLVLFVEFLSSQIACDAWEGVGLGHGGNRWITSAGCLVITASTE
mmetsp:Transcript_1673/g.4886  ORF Transcript_1673/g.4886 Transcript_1673/m.4886 type:complete len:200 (+) Transcript_1673:947-1546(+)